MIDAPIAASAPGKLFLIGEYAVLDGAPALLTAVDRRVQVQLAPAVDTEHWCLSAPNLGLNRVRLGPYGGLPRDLDAATRGKLAVFDAVRTTVAESLDEPFEPMDVVIDSGDFARDGHKLGLGSSAAVAAALTRALTHAAHRTLSKAELTALAIRGHRRAQNGAGSGGDVAASIYGGLISYVRDQDPLLLDWPESLVGLAVVTGTGARTADLVQRVRNYGMRDPHAYAADIARLSALADTAQHALTHTGRFLRLAESYHEALLALDAGADAGIVGPRHDALHALAARYNAVFKTSGAGGGDVGLAFVRRGPDETALRAALRDADAYVVPLTFGAPGVRIGPAASASGGGLR